MQNTMVKMGDEKLISWRKKLKIKWGENSWDWVMNSRKIFACGAIFIKFWGAACAPQRAAPPKIWARGTHCITYKYKKFLNPKYPYKILNVRSKVNLLFFAEKLLHEYKWNRKE